MTTNANHHHIGQTVWNAHPSRVATAMRGTVERIVDSLYVTVLWADGHRDEHMPSELTVLGH